jgi:inner membrane protein
VNGTAHTVIGAGAGFIVANTFQTDPYTTLLFIGLGGISALIPDLDIDGKLRNKITFSHKVIQTSALLIGLMVIFYSFYSGTGLDKWIGVGIGVLMIILSSMIKQKHMLIITSAGVIAGGMSLQESWLILLGIYTLIASFVSHRTYTHSILGVLFFGIIASKFQESLGIDGASYACLAGYISHLIADMKIFPCNKRGIKLFLPLSSKDI